MCFGSKSTDNGDNVNARPASSKATNAAYNSGNTMNSSIPSNSKPSNNAPAPYYDASEANQPSSSQQQNAQPPAPPQAMSSDHAYYAPPPGPPPPPQQEPYHDWQTAVPDTSLLPPPPALGNYRSVANNATEEEAEQGKAWCEANPLYGPVMLNPQAQSALAGGEVGVVIPRPFKGALNRTRPGVWRGTAQRACPDCCVLSTVPLYSVYAHSPLQTNQSKTIYYEVRISERNRQEVTLAIGFSAPPYPTFRCPGWHRGSLAVHGDDGSRYVNDMWGGRDFTTPFKPGETVGIGMTFSRNPNAGLPSYQGTSNTENVVPISVEVFMTKNGKKAGGWNLHEENDAVEDLPVTGLEGFHDLLASVGVFKEVEFDIIFNEREWMYRP